MFSPKLIVFIAFVAVAATYPANDDIPRPITTIMETDIEEPSLWFNFPSLHHIFGQISNMFTSFTNIGPTIDVDDDKFRIIVNVKDYKKENLKRLILMTIRKSPQHHQTAKNLPSRTMSMTIPNNEVNEVSAANEVKP
ncbi:unnamed protein product [Euphydryas editha]|uniref:Uncharacterized protein n=1 Tax=Euphydryas editha TaxID=104508 RepID=A0AAU9UYV5_EUPED|nr:unnamed protein product [Euphydryas editha]